MVAVKPTEFRCVRGHAGPWRHVEMIEVWREVLEVTDDAFVVDSEWRTGEGYNDGVPGSSYLLCWASVPGGRCVDQVSLPFGTIIDWY